MNKEKTKEWLKKNWSTALLTAFLAVILISPDAKTWFMRQVISTGVMNLTLQDQSKKSNEKSTSEIADFRLQDEDGRIVSTKELRGKVVFMNFWASWCPPCRAEFPSVQKFFDRYKDDPNVVFLTVNLDDQAAAGRNYLDKQNFTLPLLVPASDIPPAYYTGSLPTTVVLDKKGEIRLHHTGMADYSKDSFYKKIDAMLAE
ncbi:TlpA family protein disulfide reductase [Chryseobacterium sp. cx-311]|uniref:TlpA family protein disulfide reductase n=1 Tax=Marnyiella aurantia TaxID=2758037 RepID=UPI001AE3F4A0|nr:TlpA disulfide reductase family protein [Marnyiella aurantia]MBP0613418.1 TlpA family protein disulfide reductase [Marnyiella aurantia]